MYLWEALDRIRFATSTLDDLSGKSINTLFNNQNIIQQLQFALDRYAAETIALEGLYTMSLSVNEHQIDQPPLILRSKGYRFIEVFIQGVKYFVDVKDLNLPEAAFRYEWKGIPRWVVPWRDKINIYPTASSPYYETTLTEYLPIDGTEIHLADSSGLLQRSGQIQIGDEKIYYEYNTDNVLYNCTRGDQDTIPQAHDNGDVVKENNLWVYYYKKHSRIPVINNVISDYWLNKQLEVCDEDMEIITSYTAGCLLAKIDPTRRKVYDDKFADELVMAKARLRRGRRMINKSGDIRNQMWFESNNPGVYLQ